MQLAHNGRAELKIGLSAHEQAHALIYRLHIELFESDRLSIFFGRIFDIHRHIVNEPSVYKRLHLVRESSVGVELYEIAHVFYAPCEVIDVFIDKRLAACYAHAVEHTLTLFEKRKKFFLRNLIFVPAGKNQLRILAERAAEVASAEEHSASHLAGKIEQCKFLQTSDAHTNTPFQAVKIETEKIGLSVPAKSIIYHESALVTKNILKNCTKITTK